MLSFCLAVTFCCYRFIFFNLLSLPTVAEEEEETGLWPAAVWNVPIPAPAQCGENNVHDLLGLCIPTWGKIILLSLWSFMRGGDGASSTNLKRWKVQLVPFSFLAWWYIWSVFSYCEISLAKAPATSEFTGLKKVHLQRLSPRTTLKQNSSYLATFLFSLIRITIKYQDSSATEETLDDALGHKYSALLLLWLFSSAT